MSNALMIIDAQDPWARYNPETTRRLCDFVRLMRTLDAARQMPIIWVYMQDLAFGPLRMSPSLREIFSEEVENSCDLHNASDFVMGKEQQSAFSNDELPYFLDRMNITSLYLAGFMASQCVLRTALDSVRHVDTFLLVDLIADLGDMILPAGDQDLSKAVVPRCHSQYLQDLVAC